MRDRFCKFVIIIILSYITRSFSGHFWHISDLHIDYSYVVGGNISDHCRKSQDKAANVTEQELVGPAGNYHCDSPLVLAMSALDAMKKIHGDPDFILWTGDSAPHWNTPASPDMTYIMNVTQTVFTELEHLFPGVPIIPALGNHDVSPTNQFPISTAKDPSPEYYSSLLEHGGWLTHVPEGESVRTFNKCGYYAKTFQTTQNMTMKFLILNTNIYLHDKLASGEDPCEQLAWLNQTIAQANASNELLYIVSHVPPKFQFNTPKQFSEEIHDRYMKIITNSDNSNKICAHIYAHYHSDTFEIFLDGERRNETRGVAFIGSSVSPVTGVNPGIRLFSFDNVDGTLLDYDQYYLDLQYLNEKFDIITQNGENGKTNKTVYVSSFDDDVKNNEALTNQIGLIKDYVSHPSFTKHYTGFLAKKWKLLYKATQAFSIPRLSKDYMFEAFTTMVQDGVNSSMFGDYCAHSTLSHVARCGEDVWRKMLCTVTSMGEREQQSCVEGTGRNGFQGFKTSKLISISTIAVSPTLNHANDLDSNDIFIVVSSILFIFVMTLLLSVLYYRNQRENLEDTEQVLLRDSDFQYGGLHVEYE